MILFCNPSKNFLTLLLILGLSAPQAFAATTSVYLSKPIGNEFTLEMAKQYALAGGETTIQIAREQIDEAKGVLESAQGQRRPTVSASFGVGAQYNMGQSSNAYGTHNIGISFPFLNNAITTSINSSKNVVLSKEQVYLAQLNQAMLAVTIDYYNTIKANKNIVAAQKLAEASQAYFNSEANKLKSGVGSKIDMLTAKLQFDNSVSGVTNAKMNANLACANLTALINVEDTSICSRLVDPAVPSRFNVDVNAALTKAMNSRPEISANQSLIAAARDQRAGIGGLKNHVTGSVGISNGTAGNASGISGIDPMRTGSSNTVGANISFTWGGSEQGNIRQANARIDQANTMLTDTQKNIRKEVLVAKAILDQSFANKQSAQMSFDDAASLLNTYQSQVKSGITITDSNAYVQVLIKHQQAQQALFEADCNVAEAIAQLQAAVGAPATMNVFEFLVSGILQ